MDRFARLVRVALLPVALVAAQAAPASAQRGPAHTFALGDSTFLLDGRPFQIISGELHFQRIPRAYWRQRLQMARAMGLNTIATYVFWNDLERTPGTFDFRTGSRDVRAFVRMAQEEGLWVILRPGPYVCAEWDFGGLPWWLLRDTTVVVRSADPRFLAASARYMRALGGQLRDLQVTHGGPILMVQVENEYGSFGADSAYKDAIRRQITDAGFDVPLFTADGDWLFARGGIPGVLPGGNGEDDADTLIARVNRFHGGHGPYLVPEFYPGWLDHWGGPFERVPVDSVVPAYERLLARGISVNLYMWHGGTNFGFTAGANSSRDAPFEPDLTSYDYDAPLDEAGRPTPKYFALRAAIARHVTYAIPPVPDFVATMALPAVPLAPAASLADLIAGQTPVNAERPLTFEALDQGSGYVLYRHVLAAGVHGALDVPWLHDYAVVLVNGLRVAVLDRSHHAFSALLTAHAGDTLDLLVEDQGRINYGPALVRDRKGIAGPVLLEGAPVSGWEMYRLPMDAPPRAASHPVLRAGAPAVYRGSFQLTRIADTFLDLRGFGKGIVFVNGINLGRYWKIGPQQTLYLPGAFLHPGANDIVIFEQLNNAVPAGIAGLDAPILSRLLP